MKTNKKIVTFMMAGTMMFSVVSPIYAYEDVNIHSASDEIEHLIGVGKRLRGQTEYVYGGGHSNWNEQKEYNLPLEVDSSSFVAWVLYKGMGIDIGSAPIASQYKNYFNEVGQGDLSKAQRGDLVVSDTHIEIYLGKDESGKDISLAATDKENGVSIIETNWGRGLTGVSILRPSIEEAKEGKNGLSYNEEARFNEKDLLGMGGDEITIDGSGKGSVTSKDETKEEKEEGIENTENTENNPKEESSNDSLFTWLDPIVDFTGTSNTHSKSKTGEKTVDGKNKGLKGNKGGIFSGIFGK